MLRPAFFFGIPLDAIEQVLLVVRFGFLIEGMDVPLDGIGRETKLRGNVGARSSLPQEHEHLALPCRQRMLACERGDEGSILGLLRARDGLTHRRGVCLGIMGSARMTEGGIALSASFQEG